MAKRRSHKRSAKAKHAKRAKRRASRKGKMPAGLKAYWASKRGAKASGTKRRGRRSGRKHRRVRQVLTSSGANVVIQRVPRGTVKRARVRKGRGSRIARRRVRAVSVNPSFLGLADYTRNLKAVMGEGVKGFAAAAVGAGGSVFAGTLLQRITTPIVGRVLPGVATSAIGARVIAAGNFLLASALLARFLPVSPRAKRAMQVGGVTAAVLELAKPGLVRDSLARLPVVGPVFGSTLSGIESDLGDYVEAAVGDLLLSGEGQNAAIANLMPFSVGDYQQPLGYDAYGTDDGGVAGLSDLLLSDYQEPLGCDTQN